MPPDPSATAGLRPLAALDDERPPAGKARHPGRPRARHPRQGEDGAEEGQPHLAAVGVAGDEEMGVDLAEGEVGLVAEDDVEARRSLQPSPPGGIFEPSRSSTGTTRMRS